jgi:polysaccharide pyruvyl transferase WcaK-like protein
MTATVAYLGWNGRGNTGDDAIFEAVSEGLAPAAVETFPLYAAELARSITSGSSARFRRSHLLLGGGTLVGRSVWRKNLRLKAFPLVRRRPRFMIGAGVEDPSFQGRHSFSDDGRELARWPAVLSGFHRVTVRGPRSQELLAGVGVAADVVGDPALLLSPLAPAGAGGKVVGVTLGFGDDLWGHDHRRVEVAVVACLRELIAEGWRVRLLCMNDEDRTGHAAVARGLAAQVEEVSVEVVDTPASFLQAASECAVVVAERLHAMVLAAAAGTPFVALEYQPKCLDFTASVEWERWSVRTDSVTAGALCQLVGDLVEDDGARARLAGSVDLLRRRLNDEVLQVRQAVGAAP